MIEKVEEAAQSLLRRIWEIRALQPWRFSVLGFHLHQRLVDDRRQDRARATYARRLCWHR